MNDLSRLNADAASTPTHKEEAVPQEELHAMPISNAPEQAQPSLSLPQSESPRQSEVSVEDVQATSVVDTEKDPEILENAVHSEHEADAAMSDHVDHDDADQPKAFEGDNEYNCARVVGAHLTKLREEKNWLLDDVSAQLKVPVSKLRALEAGEVSVLPDAAFTLGLVRSYSKMLGADPTPFIEELRNANGPLKEALAGLGMHRELLTKNVLSAPYLAKSRGAIAQRFRGRIAMLVGLGIACIAVIGLLIYGYNEASLKTVSTDAQSVSDAANAQSLPSPAELTAPSSTEAPIAGQDNKQTLSNATVAPAAPTSAETVLSKSIPPVPGTIPPVMHPATAPNVAPAAAPGVVAQAGRVAIVHFRVSQDNWISVSQADGKLLYAGLLKAGAERSMRGLTPFKIIAGSKTGLDTVTLDGKPVDLSRYLATKQDVVRFNLL